jgi:fructokinase
MKRQGVISFGEAFIDLISIDDTNKQYQQLLGGATVNVAVGTSRLGIPTYYLCQLGNDINSLFIKNQLELEKVDTSYCVHNEKKEICRVVIHLNNEGDRYFHSYQNPTPKEVLNKNQLNDTLFAKANIFYFGSGTLFQPVAKETTQFAIDIAREKHLLIAFDANIRLKRWDTEELCKETIREFIKKADVVKLSEEELAFLTNMKTLEEGLQDLMTWNIPFAFVTLGREGALVLQQGKITRVSSKQVDTKDTTGAGDAFMSALLYCFHERDKVGFDLEVILQFANEIAALSTTELGSLTACKNLSPIIEKYFY